MNIFLTKPRYCADDPFSIFIRPRHTNQRSFSWIGLEPATRWLARETNKIDLHCKMSQRRVKRHGIMVKWVLACLKGKMGNWPCVKGTSRNWPCYTARAVVRVLFKVSPDEGHHWQSLLSQMKLVQSSIYVHIWVSFCRTGKIAVACHFLDV